MPCAQQSSRRTWYPKGPEQCLVRVLRYRAFTARGYGFRVRAFSAPRMTARKIGDRSPGLPDGQISTDVGFRPVQPRRQKYFCFSETKSDVELPPSRPA